MPERSTENHRCSERLKPGSRPNGTGLGPVSLVLARVRIPSPARFYKNLEQKKCVSHFVLKRTCKPEESRPGTLVTQSSPASQKVLAFPDSFITLVLTLVSTLCQHLPRAVALAVLCVVRVERVLVLKACCFTSLPANRNAVVIPALLLLLL